MKGKDRDTLDDLFRSKLYDFEADAAPDDWAAIADRLPGRPLVPWHRKLSYWAAAAVVALLVVAGGLYIYDKDSVPAPIAQEVEKQTKIIENRMAEEIVPPALNQELPAETKGLKQKPTIAKNFSTPIKVTEREDRNNTENVSVATAPPVSVKQEEKRSESLQRTDPENIPDNPLMAEDTPVMPVEKKSSSRKWGFGMGAGSFSMSSNSVVPQYVTSGSNLRGETLMIMNSANFDSQEELPKTDIKHKTPISFGFAVSRFLNDRFALQTGLTYTYLRSDWKTNGTFSGETKQGLHFIGVPLSLTYKIAEWNRFNFYASAGGMAEVNVAGRRITRFIAPTEDIAKEKENVRMKEWLWSLNANTGVSYPLIRFVSAFAEVGASYYFDNGSAIETVRSEKPFNVNFQFGLRLGF